MTNKEMAAPEPQANWWNFLMALLPWATLYGLMHTAIYYIFKYWSDSRDERFNTLIDAKLKPIDKKIDEIKEVVVEIRMSK